MRLEEFREAVASEATKRADRLAKETARLVKEVREKDNLEEVTRNEEQVYTRFRRMGVLSADARAKYESVLSFLNAHEGKTCEEVKTDYETLVVGMKEDAARAGERLDALFRFAEKVWGSGQELLILVTELTIGYYSSRFIARYGCEGYYRYSEELKFYERKLEILKKGEAFDYCY